MSKCDTEEPNTRGFGAYICTCPLGSTPAVLLPLAAMTSVPTKCRSPVSTLAVARSASVMAGKSFNVRWSSRRRMKVSSRPESLAPLESTKVRKPSPWPNSCRATLTRSIRPAGGLPSYP